MAGLAGASSLPRGLLVCLDWVEVRVVNRVLLSQAANQKEKYHKICLKKQNVPIKELCKGLPQEFATLLNYCRSLKFAEAPNYSYCRKLFREMFESQVRAPTRPAPRRLSTIPATAHIGTLRRLSTIPPPISPSSVHARAAAPSSRRPARLHAPPCLPRTPRRRGADGASGFGRRTTRWTTCTTGR